jgi:hypothetical protein
MPELDDATGSVHSADEGITHHGAGEPRGQSAVPRSVLFEGRFGPADQPFIYQWKSRDFRDVKLLEGGNPDTDDNGDALEREDLLRNR